MYCMPQRENHKIHAAYIRLALGALQPIWRIEVSLNNGPATLHPHPSSAFGELEEFSVITRFWEKEGWRVLPTLYLVYLVFGGQELEIFIFLKFLRECHMMNNKAFCMPFEFPNRQRSEKPVNNDQSSESNSILHRPKRPFVGK